MPNSIRSLPVAAVLLTTLGIAEPDASQVLDPSLFQEMRWRMIGPFRASRTKAGAGVPSQPNVFYIGVVNGGVWKTTDYGRTWDPIFDVYVGVLLLNAVAWWSYRFVPLPEPEEAKEDEGW